MDAANLPRMGTVTKRTDRQGRPGMWVARWVEADGTQRKRSFPRKIDGENFLADIHAATIRGDYVTPSAGKETIGSYGKRWLETKRAELAPKPKSYGSLRSLWRSRVEPRWGKVPLNQVRRTDVTAWVTEMTFSGLSSSRVRQSYHCLTAILTAAVNDGLLTRNQAADIALPKLGVSKQRHLSHAQVVKLADAAGKQHRPLVLLLAYGGLRWGEAVALLARNVDTTRGRVTVERSLSDDDGNLSIVAPKDHERRTVPLPPVVAAALKEKVKGLAPDALVFTSPRGMYLRNQNWRRSVWNDACVKAGIPGLVPHELRHTAASLAIAAGADIISVSRMLGHSSPTVTLNRYGHLAEGALEDVARRLGEAATASKQRSDSPQESSGVAPELPQGEGGETGEEGC